MTITHELMQNSCTLVTARTKTRSNPTSSDYNYIHQSYSRCLALPEAQTPLLRFVAQQIHEQLALRLCCCPISFTRRNLWMPKIVFRARLLHNWTGRRRESGRRTERSKPDDFFMMKLLGWEIEILHERARRLVLT